MSNKGGKMQTEAPIATISEHFAVVEDPRVDYLVDYPLEEILIIAICAVICGADDWVAVADWGRAKQAWLATFLPLKNGVPSHYTFRRTFQQIDPEQFQAGFMSWTQAVFRRTEGEIVAVDGKQLRGSRDKRHDQQAICMVSAWAAENRMVLGQRKTSEKSNEITAIPALLQLLDLTGCIVTIDAAGCQKENAAIVVNQNADYLLSVKGNQGHLYDDIEFLFTCAHQNDDSDHTQTLCQGHGRIETRDCWIIDDPTQLAFIRDRQKWANLQTIVMIRTIRRLDDKVESSIRYFISSLVADAARFLQIKRTHWAVENDLHWTLDLAFDEDHHQLRRGHGPANFSMLRHIAVNLLKQEETAKCGIKNKRLKAGWDNEYLLKVLQVR
jgi:predicted transposase YbfD/YdcC